MVEGIKKYVVLLVDDEESVTKSIERHLHNRFSFVTSTNGNDAIDKLKTVGNVAVIVSDYRMPGMDGIEFLKATRKLTPESVRIVLTGSESQDVAARAINEGKAYAFITKPIKIDNFELLLNDAIAQYRENATEREIVQNTLSASVKLLLDILHTMDPYSFGQCMKSKNLIQKFANQIEPPHSWACPLAAMLSRVGVMQLPQELRSKIADNASLTNAEKKIAITYPQLGADLIATIPRLEYVAEIVRYHRKNFDGSGFPVGTHAGENIPWGARLLRIINDLELEVVRGRSYRAGVAKLKKCYGYYDPEILRLVEKNIALIEGISSMDIEPPFSAGLEPYETLFTEPSSDDPEPPLAVDIDNGGNK